MDTKAEYHPLIPKHESIKLHVPGLVVAGCLGVVKENSSLKHYFNFSDKTLKAWKSVPDVEHCSESIKDIYIDTMAHSLLKLKTPLLMIYRTSVKPPVLIFKRVQQERNLTIIDNITNNLDVLHQLFLDGNITTDMKSISGSHFPNNYASYHYSRHSINFGSWHGIQLSIIFDECQSDYFEGIYRVGFLHFSFPDDSLCMKAQHFSYQELLPPKLCSVIHKNDALLIDSKIMYSLLFLNPRLYHKFLSTSQFSQLDTTINHLVAIMVQIENVSKQITIQQRYIFRSSIAIKRLQKKKIEWMCLKRMAIQDLDHKQYLISISEHRALTVPLSYINFNIDKWKKQYMGTVDRFVSKFYLL
jgi:hypothetical protein